MSHLPESSARRSIPVRGFTLTETITAVVLVAVAIVGMLQLIASGTRVNVAGSEMATGIRLAANVREFSRKLDYRAAGATTQPAALGLSTDIWAMDGMTISPPIDRNGSPLTTYRNWSQSISVQTVSIDQVASTGPTDPNVGLARITVKVEHAGHFVHKTSWLVTDPASGN